MKANRDYYNRMKPQLNAMLLRKGSAHRYSRKAERRRVHVVLRQTVIS